MKVTVDDDRCQGHARCWSIAPGVFDLDDEGHAVVKLAEVPPDQEQLALNAQRNCPEQAIELG